MSKKRIAIFGIKYFPSKGGTSRVVENLLLSLKDQYDFTIYCYRHKDAASHMPGVETIQYSEIPIKGFGVFLYYMKCCLHILFSDGYDMIHVHKTDGAFFLPLLCLKNKVVATSHALPYLNEKWSSIGKLYFRMTEWLFMHSKAKLTAISQPQADYYFQKYNRVVKYIPNGIHPVKKVYPELADPILKKYDIKEDYLFFAARRVIPLKGCHTLIKALQQIKFKGTLVVAGELDQLPAYTQALRKLAKGLDVKFIDYVAGMDKLNALLQRAKYFVFPSELEGMSMMLLEAGSVGTPMVCSDIPQNKAVLTSAEVLYFKSKNEKDLADKLLWAFDHPEAMQNFAEKTRQKIENEYLVSKVVKQYTDLYDSILFPDKAIPSTESI